MDSYWLEVTAFSCFMTFVCSGALLVFVIVKEQAWAQTLDWIRDELNGIEYHTGGLDGKVGDMWKMKLEKKQKRRKDDNTQR